MKKKMLLLLAFTFGCATDPDPLDSRGRIERTKENFAAVNEKVFEQADVMLDHQYKNMTLKDYDNFFKQYRFPKAIELREDMTHFDQREIYPYDKTFIVCIHNTKENYTLCDDPRCYGVEKAAKGGKETVERWLQEVPWEKCPRNPHNGLNY